MNENQTPPIKEGEIHTGKIVSVGEKGDGIMRVKGFVVFVPGVAQDDFVKVKIKKVLPKVSFADLLEKVEPPKHQVQRVVAPRQQKKEPAPEIKQLLTTKGDSDDFGVDDDDDDDDL